MRSRHRLFPIADNFPFGNVRSRHETDAWDEAYAQPGWAAGHEPTRQFLGVGLNRKRIRAGAVVCLACFLLLLARSAHLQIWEGGEYRSLAEGNRVRIEYVSALRGVIYDGNHEPLAQNDPTFRLVATPIDLPAGEAERVAYFESLPGVLEGASVAEMLSSLADAEAHPYDQVVLMDDIAYEDALAFLLMEQTYPGLQLEMGTRRAYATDRIASLSHILGYTGVVNEEEFEQLVSSGYRRIDHIGKLGVESVYESHLRGTFGRRVIETDAYGNAVSMMSKQDPVDGENLVLSIDAELTKKIEEIVKEKAGASARAAVIVMNPQNGELLALVSTPGYDANLFTSGIDASTYESLLDDPSRPLFARAISGEYPSGSTFKPIVAAAALAEGLIERETSFVSTGGISIGPWFFPDWKSGGHGVTNVTKAIAQSVNTFFYIVGGGFDTFAGLGIERIVSYAARFGFGAPLGIDLTGEASGFLPTKAWKEEAKGERWYIGDTYHVAIGQGDLLVTPLQLAAATMVFANGGVLYEPHVGHAFESEEGVTRIEPVVLNPQVVDPSAIQVVREGMRETVLSGSARSLQYLPVTMAGKTGTAQWSTSAPTHAWFTGFAPFENPEIVVTVLIEEGGGGDVIAVPIAREIVAWWYSQYNVTVPVVESTEQHSEDSAPVEETVDDAQHAAVQ